MNDINQIASNAPDESHIAIELDGQITYSPVVDGETTFYHAFVGNRPAAGNIVAAKVDGDWVSFDNDSFVEYRRNLWDEVSCDQKPRLL